MDQVIILCKFKMENPLGPVKPIYLIWNLSRGTAETYFAALVLTVRS